MVAHHCPNYVTYAPLAELCCSVRSTFQYFGLDFLIDDALHPWLMEVNATPSMRVQHDNPHTAALIYQQKWPVVWDMFQILGLGAARFQQVQ